MSNQIKSSEQVIEVSEDDAFVRSLRAHGQLKETEDADDDLDPGQTHVFVKRPGEKTGVLIARRKSFL